MILGDETPFDSTVFDEMAEPVTGGHPGASSSASAMARDQALSEPHRDPNQIRAMYDLPELDEDELELWLQG